MKPDSRSVLVAWAVVSVPAIVVLAFWAATLRSQLDQSRHHPSGSLQWTRAMIDSLNRGVALPPPWPLAPGRDSAWYATPARNAISKEEFWQQEANAARAHGNTLLAPPDLSTLKDQGLADPAEAIRADLMRHPELIPYKSNEGGFQFFPTMAVLLPGGRWVYAYFEDGMTDGYVLLEYTVDGNGHFKWRRIASKWEN